MKAIKRNGEYVRRPIKRECTVCRKEYDLLYSGIHSSQRFCEQQCHINLKKTHKGMRDHAILTVLRERGSITALEIANILSGCKLRASNRTVSNVLRLWVSRGIVSGIRPSFKKPYTYTYISESFPGELVIKYAKA